MANAAAKADENPDMSMEDILHSIRKIIAEDNTGAATPASGQEATFGSDVLELTDLVETETPAAPEAMSGDAALAAGGMDIMAQIAEATAPAAPEPSFEPEAVAETFAAAPSAAAAPAAFSSQVDRLISDSVASASAASLRRVIETHKAATPMPHFRTGNTLEDLVLETLKPILKEWLDAHLPTMVERIVEREIRKLVE